MSVARAERGVEHFLGLENGLTEEEDEILTFYKTLRSPASRESALGLLRVVVNRDRKEHGGA